MKIPAMANATRQRRVVIRGIRIAKTFFGWATSATTAAHADDIETGA
jgi:hypothetical protein